jgi:LmbE family N-acetylglucosaminyl deacetylase
MNVIVIGAHPDDCEYRCAGTAAKWSAAGHRVKFMSLTNGDAGHHEMTAAALIDRRRAESERGAALLGVAEVQVCDFHDGLLEPTLAARDTVIRAIRAWQADLVITHRPNDYHPDHRYTSALVQDSAYMVLVPAVCRDTPPLRANPVYLYMEDEFQKPYPFQADIAVAIDDVWRRKVDSLDAHVSQFYEWLPWVDGIAAEVPKDAAARRQWLETRLRRALPSPIRAALVRRYGAASGQAEAYELCEYGRQPSPAELDTLLPR